MSDTEITYIIKGDSSGLRATLQDTKRQIKTAATDAASTKLKIGVALDSSKIRSEAMALVRSLQASLPPIRLRVAFDMPGGRLGGMPSVRGGSPMLAGGPVAGQRMLPAPGGTSSPNWVWGNGSIAGAGAPAWQRGPQANPPRPQPIPYGLSSRVSSSYQGGIGSTANGNGAVLPMALRPGTQQYAASLAGGDGGRSIFTRPLGPLGTVLGIGAINAGLHGAANYLNESAAQPGDTAAMRDLRKRMAVQGGLSSIPLVGGVSDFAYAASGYGRQMQKDMTEETDRQSAGRSGRTFASDRFTSSRVELAGLRGDESAGILQGGRDRESAIKNARAAEWQAFGDKGNGSASRDFRDATRSQLAREQAITDQQMADLGERKKGARDVENTRYEVSKYSRLSTDAAVGGDSMQALVQQLQGGRMGLVGSGDARLVGVKDQAQRATITAANKEELDAFNADASRQVDQKRKAQGADTLTAAGAVREASLRAAKKDYEADLEAFDTNEKAKQALIEDTAEKQNEATRSGAQRSIMVARHAQAVSEAVASNQATATGAYLRSEGQGRLAARREFDLNAAAELARTPDDLKKSVAARQAAQRADLVHSQDIQSADLSGSLKARAFGAIASGGGMNRLASEYGLLAGQQAELRGADAEDRSKIRATQLSELQAQRRQLLEGNRDTRAVEFDARRMAGSDEASKAVRETNALLALIQAGIDKLVAKDDGATAQ